MRVHPKYLVTFFALLILVGFCDWYPISILNGKNLKQTEWVTSENRKGKRTKCYYYNHSDYRTSNITALPWSKESIKLYGQLLSVVFLSQIKTFNCQIISNLVQKRLHFPRLSIDDYANFCMREEILPSSNGTGKIGYKHLLSRKWIILRRNSNGKEKDVLDGCLIGFL
jgi:hypothetical protein